MVEGDVKHSYWRRGFKCLREHAGCSIYVPTYLCMKSPRKVGEIVLERVIMSQKLKVSKMSRCSLGKVASDG